MIKDCSNNCYISFSVQYHRSRTIKAFPNSLDVHTNSWFWHLSIPYHSLSSLPSLIPSFPSTHLFFYFALELANSIRSPLATSNPKLRWDFFAPPGKPLHSSVELMFPSLGAECTGFPCRFFKGQTTALQSHLLFFTHFQSVVDD